MDDFERPLRFSWSGPARILTAEVTEVSPESLQPTIKVGVNEIVVDPLLLNPGDWLQIKTMINQSSKLSVDARVVGVKQITKAVASGEAMSGKKLRMIALMGFVGSLTILVGEGLRFWTPNGRTETRIVQFFVFGLLFFLAEEVKVSVLNLISFFKKKDSLR